LSNEAEPENKYRLHKRKLFSDPRFVDTAVRLAAYFGTSERFWLGLQMDYDLEQARESIGRLPITRVHQTPQHPR
jgi:aspartate-semialdehyde dehydrogenase